MYDMTNRILNCIQIVILLAIVAITILYVQREKPVICTPSPRNLLNETGDITMKNYHTLVYTDYNDNLSQIERNALKQMEDVYYKVIYKKRFKPN